MTGGNVDSEARAWLATALPEQKVFRLEEDYPDGLAALQKAGYEGDVWFEVKALSAADDRARQSLGIVGTAGTKEYRLDIEKSFRFDAMRMIVDARLPVLDEDGTVHEYEWEKASGRQNKNLEQLDRLGQSLNAWLNDILSRMRGEGETPEAAEQTEADIEEAGNSSCAAVS